MLIVATKHPRIAVTLPADTLATLAKLATLQKKPRSAIAADLLVEMTPALARIATVLEVAIDQRAKLPAQTAQRLEVLEELLGSVATFGLDRMEASVTPPRGAIPRAAGKPRRRRGH